MSTNRLIHRQILTHDQASFEKEQLSLGVPIPGAQGRQAGLTLWQNILDLHSVTEQQLALSSMKLCIKIRHLKMRASSPRNVPLEVLDVPSIHHAVSDPDDVVDHFGALLKHIHVAFLLRIATDLHQIVKQHLVLGQSEGNPQSRA